MTRRKCLASVLLLVALLLISAWELDAAKGGGSRRSSSSGSSGWGWGSSSKSRSTPKSNKPQQQTNQGGSRPGQIGWSVPSNNQRPSSNTGSTGTGMQKPSAPSSDYMSKSSATNVQSGYNPASKTSATNVQSGYNPATKTGATNVQSGYPGYPNNGAGYNTHQGNPPSYNQATGGGYHGAPPSYGQATGGYHPSGGYGGSYHGAPPSYGNMGHGYSSQPGAGYNPSYGHSSFGNPQPQTVILSQGSRPGIGQLAKEAFVFAGVSAGVNAAVNRLLPGGIYGHSMGSSSSGVVPPVSHTQITYNNYYNNGTGETGTAQVVAPVPPAAPAAAAPALAASDPAPTTQPGAPPAVGEPAPADNQQQQQQQQQEQNNPSPLGFIISDTELQKLTEQLFDKDANNAYKHITINLQGHKTDESSNDDAAENLLDVKADAWEIPTVKAVLALHDNYELDVKTKETVTSEERKEESDLLDAFVATDVMKAVMKFLAEKGYVPDDEYEFKDTLKRIWFSQFKRIDGEPSSSGFETVFLAEKFEDEIIGLHDWIYFAKQEEAKKLNYLGYIKKLDLGTNGAIVKGRSSLNDIVQPITTIFVGTSPELEMALYTICFYTRPNNVCPVTLGGANFLIVANRVNYFGKDILISAFADI